MSQLKRCKTCGEEKKLSLFHKHSGCKHGVANSCKECRNQKAREYYLEDYVGSVARYKSAYMKQAEDHVGDWAWHFKKLISRSDRKALSVEGLLALLESQQGVCALSGVSLTCVRGTRDKLSTNVSIDRIEAGGPYIFSNIRLVCRAVNSMRNNMTDEELTFWCKRIIDAI